MRQTRRNPLGSNVAVAAGGILVGVGLAYVALKYFMPHWRRQPLGTPIPAGARVRISSPTKLDTSGWVDDASWGPDDASQGRLLPTDWPTDDPYPGGQHYDALTKAPSTAGDATWLYL